jgi:hypothetical protein
MPERLEDRMPSSAPQTLELRDAEPTLAALATRFVRRTVPHQLFQVMQLALPLAVDFAWRDWWRGAGWAFAVTAFGAWGLADRWLAQRELDALHASPTSDPAQGKTAGRIARTVRAVAGTVATLLPALLLLDLFLRLLGNAPIS